MVDKVDAVVIGAGVIGLAVARRLAMAGREVLILEKADAIGTETSSRNSEVIHAGIYYPAGSLKARLCVRGRQLLYAYCAERGVPHKRVGKLLVAASATALSCKVLVNASGLHAPSLARRIEGLPEAGIPLEYLCKGSYFTLTGRAPFTRLIYPIPGHAGLGVHLTLDLGGQAKFGPDTEWIDREDYSLDPRRAEVFYEAVRRYWPSLPDGALAPGYTGIRPKISGPHEPAADFAIAGPAAHGVPGLVNLYGIESPGLTASLAIAEEVLRRIDG
jgi:L-2-hydroxyglutarate oxidase LhgO